MFQELRPKIQECGTTLIEIIVVVFITVIFSSILISNFPEILRQFALSRVTYKLAQDIRKTQNWGASGVLIAEEIDGQSQQIMAKGYGVYINLVSSWQYIIYADRGESPNFKYDGNSQLCSQNLFPFEDCVIETINIALGNPDLYIKEIINIGYGYSFTSMNFSPPNPNTSIDNLGFGSNQVGIVVGSLSEASLSKTVWVNTAGLIRIE